MDREQRFLLAAGELSDTFLKSFRTDKRDLFAEATKRVVQSMFKAGYKVNGDIPRRMRDSLYERWDDLCVCATFVAYFTAWDVLAVYLLEQQQPAAVVDKIASIILKSLAQTGRCSFGAPNTEDGISPLLFAARHCGPQTVGAIADRYGGNFFVGEGAAVMACVAQACPEVIALLARKYRYYVPSGYAYVNARLPHQGGKLRDAEAR